MPSLFSRSHKLATCVLLLALWSAGQAAAADEYNLRVAVIAHSPPLSYTDQNGRLTGFNIEIARALCDAMKALCTLHAMPIEKIVTAVSDDVMDFAVVAFVVTADRSRKILFSKPYFQSISVWLAKPAIAPGSPGSKVAVISGSAQASHAQAMGWTTITAISQKEISLLLSSGVANAAVMPMLGALALMQEKPIQMLNLKSTVLFDPALTGTLHLPINPKKPELVNRINAALDLIKRDGRFDHINSEFIPFKLL